VIISTFCYVNITLINQNVKRVNIIVFITATYIRVKNVVEIVYVNTKLTNTRVKNVKVPVFVLMGLINIIVKSVKEKVYVFTEIIKDGAKNVQITNICVNMENKRPYVNNVEGNIYVNIKFMCMHAYTALKLEDAFMTAINGNAKNVKEKVYVRIIVSEVYAKNVKAVLYARIIVSELNVKSVKVEAYASIIVSEVSARIV
jgi:hypothetical protein